jgi:hypothetical protein
MTKEPCVSMSKLGLFTSKRTNSVKRTHSRPGRRRVSWGSSSHGATPVASACADTPSLCAHGVQISVCRYLNTERPTDRERNRHRHRHRQRHRHARTPPLAASMAMVTLTASGRGMVLSLRTSDSEPRAMYSITINISCPPCVFVCVYICIHTHPHTHKPTHPHTHIPTSPHPHPHTHTPTHPHLHIRISYIKCFLRISFLISSYSFLIFFLIF